MKHTGDYELDEINMLEQECADLEEENKRLEEENKKLKECNWELIENHKKDISILCEENKKLKLHIEAKDKAYVSLLKDYEEIKEDNKKLKAEIWERLNAIRQKI